MVRQRKFYPGERRDPSLDRFSRVPTRSEMPADFAPASYQTPPSAAPKLAKAGEPLSPARILFGAAACVLALLMAMLLLFGGGQGGMLDGAPVGKRLLLAVFTALVAGAFFVMANPGHRLRGGAIAALVAVALVALALVGGESRPTLAGSGIDERPDEAAAGVDGIGGPGQSVDGMLKQEVGYEPLAEALREYPGPMDGSPGRAVGVWLRDLQDFNKIQIMDFLKRKTGAEESSWLYPRPPDDYLLVLEGVAPDLGAIETLCRRFGRVRGRFDHLNLLEVEVDNERFVQGPLQKLQDPSDPAFYELNRRELESIDLERAHRAVKRLMNAEPVVYRHDIVRRLQELVKEGEDLDLERDAARALTVWAEEGDGSVALVRSVTRELHDLQRPVPVALVAFLARNRDPEFLPLLESLWIRDPGDWEQWIESYGEQAEELVLRRLASEDVSLRFSAVRVLGEIGTARSEPALEALRPEATSELEVLIDRAQDAIRGRRP